MVLAGGKSGGPETGDDDFCTVSATMAPAARCFIVTVRVGQTGWRQRGAYALRCKIAAGSLAAIRVSKASRSSDVCVK